MGPRSLLHWGLVVSVPYLSPKHRHHAERVLGPKPSPGAEGTAVTGHLPPLAGSTASAHSPGRRPAGGTAQGPQPARVSSDGGQGEAIWQRTLTLTRSRRFIQVHERVGGRVRSEGGAGVCQADLLCLLGVPPDGAFSMHVTRRHTKQAPPRIPDNSLFPRALLK